MKLDQYTDFNRSADVDVKSIVVNRVEIGAVCSYKCQSNDVFFLPQATLTYVAKGEKRLFTNGHSYHMKAGDLLYLPQYTVVHSEITSSSFKSINLCIPEWLAYQPKNVTALSTNILFFNQQRAIKRLFDSLFVTKTASHDLTEKELQELLLWCRVEQHQGRKKTVHQTDSNRIISSISEHIYTPSNSPEIAAACHMSLASYKRKFERIFNEAPKTWIRKRKLENAFFQLQTQKGTVSDTCLQVGFENKVHFAHQFKKQFGLRPSDLLKSEIK